MTTRSDIDARCQDCGRQGLGMGCCLPGLRSPICLEAPGPMGTYISIYALKTCPLSGGGGVQQW
jgi:hypothetical protein